MTSWLDRLRGRRSSDDTAATTPPAAHPTPVTAPDERVRALQREERRERERKRQEDQRLERLAAGGFEREEELRGAVRGKHFTEWPEPVRQLKREGRLTEALELLHECIAAAERCRGTGSPAPWYTENAAIIYRQLGDHDAEVAVLERWVRAAPQQYREGKITERLAKALAVRARHQA